LRPHTHCFGVSSQKHPHDSELRDLFGKDMYRIEHNRVVRLLVLKLVKNDDGI
jgi:hypothetical protein